MDPNPSYFVPVRDGDIHRTNMIYKATVHDYNFSPSPECVEIGFFSPEEAAELPLFDNVREFLKVYTV